LWTATGGRYTRAVSTAPIVKNTGVGLFLKDAVKANLFATYTGKPPKSAWNYLGEKLDTMNAAMCEVAVDTETGQVEILRFGVVADTGKIMRRTSLERTIRFTST
jgi:CO/xanthine dehydrogenase Mo-binding subunit